MLIVIVDAYADNIDDRGNKETIIFVFSVLVMLKKHAIKISVLT
jgi:hypothetical protein